MMLMMMTLMMMLMMMTLMMVIMAFSLRTLFTKNSVMTPAQVSTWMCPP